LHVDRLSAGIDERIEAGATGVHCEDIAGAAVLEGINHERHVVLELEVPVALLGEAHDAVGSWILAANAERERPRTGQDAYEGSAGGPVSFSWFHHHEFAGGRRRCPGGLVQEAVEAQRIGERTDLKRRTYRFLGGARSARAQDRQCHDALADRAH
jgi:hypothetical protein